MNILNLAASDEGGAGLVCRNTNQFLIDKGYNSVLVVKESNSRNNNVFAFKKIPLPGTWKFKLKEWGLKLEIRYRKIVPFETDDRHSFFGLHERKRHYSAKKILKKVPFKPDVIVMHWVSGFVNSKTMKELVELTGAKMFWLMTDNAPITGGCHYPWDCKGFETDCSNCPGILTKSKKKVVEKNLAFKKKNLPDNLELFAGSTSDYQRATHSLLFKERKTRWLFPPIDEKKFAPEGKEEARKHFGIKDNTRVIFYGASHFINQRKGGKFFLEALNIINREVNDSDKPYHNFQIMIAGIDSKEYFSDVALPMFDVGFLNEDNLIKAFQAADIFVSPSVEDSGPAMVLQSIMCGTPVVAFNTGIAMNVVEKGKTGYLANLSDAADLAEGLMYMLRLSDQELKTFSENCRQLVLNKYTLDHYIDGLIEAFP